MAPSLALLLWLVLLAILLYFDPANVRRTSLGLWIPVIWMFIIGSRLPSQWLDGVTGQAAGSLEEGNPLDRSVFFGLLLVATGILLARSVNLGTFLRRNLALMTLVLFALASVLWSDFPFVTFKRWIRDLGNYLVILVVVTDPHPIEALGTVLRRVCFLLMPLSILLVKYYPALGRHYDPWTGVAGYSGATTSKNMLGVTCLIGGLFFFWDTVTRWSTRNSRRTKRVIAVNLLFLGMTLWLLNLSNSATSSLCFVLGCTVIAAANTKASHRHPAVIKVILPAAFVLYVVLALGFNINAHVAGAVNRDPTLTDRTKIWTLLLAMHTNPLIGTGYESFWLGPRLQQIWQRFGRLNEAHDGYLEVYLNLGGAGLFLLLTFLVASYKRICIELRPSSGLASLALAMWTILLLYSVTEVGFRTGPLWVTFLLVILVVPRRSTLPNRYPGTSAAHSAAPTSHVDICLER